MDQLTGFCSVGLKEDPVQTSDPILHKQYRRLFASAISPRAVQTYWSMQIRQARTMTLDVITSPLGYMQAVKRAVAAISFLVAYGYELKDDDEMLLEADRGLRIFEKLMTPGAWLVDVLPILQVIPSWFPGANFKRLAKAWGHFLEETRDTPFNWVKTDLAAGKAKPSFVAQLLQEQDDTHGRRFPETRIRWTAGVIYGAGSDTSVAAIHTFLAAMVQYPEVQMKAQAELDSVIGRERPPTIADRDSLPYCWAVVQETLRWQPVATLGLPHVLQNDEEFEGYFLPKGTTVLANVIYMSRDEHEYPSADEFKPERFLAEDGTSLRSESFGFGFGRRVCPGVHLAEATIFGAVISLLFTANISWPENAERTITYEKALGVK
ncbi:cytochrome P450 [Calocera viscosa TUFC12733]|uniref:Cytochrome P450 n=1 Tax=Calocera viscosa (strain TUFC12733) TaxID=1330018 RepID=A0A167QFK6_CALVF|nr:cytochrome P450 [Calocera viscosa TUFC12733]